VRVPVAAPQVVTVAAPAPVVQAVAPQARTTSSTGNIGNLFGDGNFNVRFNTPDFNIEY